MRRNFRVVPKPQKEFIHTYHINQVPLPYYNPLEDPHLKSYFSNSKVSKHIQQMGFVYEPRKEYPYSNRRTKNAYKFHKDNSYEIPLTHQIKNSQVSKSFMFYSQRDFNQDQHSPPQSPMLMRRSQTDFFNKINNKIPSLSQILSKRPSTHTQKKRILLSSDGKAHSRIFQKKSFSSNKMQNRKNPQND